jgi:hypothetical protein
MDAYATILATEAEVGRTRSHLACPCGATFWRFVWSWAGHGYTRCPACTGYILYDPHLVYCPTREEAIQARQEGRSERRVRLLRHIRTHANN